MSSGLLCKLQPTLPLRCTLLWTSLQVPAHLTPQMRTLIGRLATMAVLLKDGAPVVTAAFFPPTLYLLHT